MAATVGAHSLVLIEGFVQTFKYIVEKNAAGFAVDVIPIGPFPKLLQIKFILHNLLNQIRKIKLGHA